MTINDRMEKITRLASELEALLNDLPSIIDQIKQLANVQTAYAQSTTTETE
jgi:hypothetical protein